MAFPAVALLDSFKRGAESPLSNGGKWTIIAGSTRAGQISEEAEGPITAYSEGEDNAYWNPATFTFPAVESELRRLPEVGLRYVTLWACLSSPGTGERSGYRLRAVETGVGKFTLITERMTKALFTTLGETLEVALAIGDRIALQVANGQVLAWKKIGAGAWTQVHANADTTYQTGYVGVGGKGNRTRLRNFEAGVTHEHTLTASQPSSPSRTIALARTLGSGQSQAASTARAPARALGVVQAQAGGIQRSLARSLSATAAGTVTLARDSERLLAVAQPTAGLLARSLARTLTVGQGQLAQLTDAAHEAPHSGVGISSSSVEPKALVGAVAV